MLTWALGGLLALSLVLNGYVIWWNGERAGEAWAAHLSSVQAWAERQDTQTKLDRCRGIRNMPDKEKP